MSIAIPLCNLPLRSKLAIYVSCMGVGFGLGLSFLICSLPWAGGLLMLCAARVWLGPSTYFCNLPWAGDMLLLRATRVWSGPCISSL